MKIIVDRKGCVGHARCQAVAPDLFPGNDEGYIDIDGFDVPEGQEGLARRGARSCPERIIHTVDDPTGEVWPPKRRS